MENYVVVCSRNGSLPQVVGQFSDEEHAIMWIVEHALDYPLWALSPARVDLEPGRPAPWVRNYRKRHLQFDAGVASG